MTIWNARRSGNRILCGWTDIHTGRQTCGDLLGRFPGKWPDRRPDAEYDHVMFLDFYEPADLRAWSAATIWSRDNPHTQGQEPVTVLRIGSPAAARLASGQAPRRRRHAKDDPDRYSLLVEQEDGSVISMMGYSLPVVLPCGRHGHPNRVDASTVQVDNPTPRVVD